jgi:uncharacterized repeat protein (TIGR03803 family)
MFMTNGLRRRHGLIFEESLRDISMLALTVALLPILAPWPAQAQTFHTLYSFTGGPDGGYPYAGLLRDKAGNLYGTTLEGGRQACQIGCGTVFKLGKHRKETVLHSFAGGPKDGAFPWAGLVPDAAGNLYGTTSVGGASDQGTVFKVSKTGQKKVLFSFPVGLANGQGPLAGLVRDAAGNLYGTTPGGGVFGYGIVFKVTATGQETVLHNFTGGNADGATPYPGPLVLEPSGNLYGTTCSGGAYGDGTVFKLDKTATESLLYSFTGGADGRCPTAGLVRDRAGTFYGTTVVGGVAECKCGTVFKLDKTGTETTLYTFTGGADGGFPSSGALVLDSVGNLYGTTSGGGTNFGVIFKVTPSSDGWTETVLHTFAGSDGGGPSGLIRDAAGNLYGTTSEFGPENAGTVFKLTP